MMNLLLAAVGRDTSPTGICRVAASHLQALLTSGFCERPHLAIGPWQREAFELLLGDRISQVTIVPAEIANNSVSRNAWYRWTLPKLALEAKADMVHYSFPAPCARDSFGCPVVLTLHDLYPFDIPENFGFPQHLVNQYILRQCVKAVDGIACVSNTTQARFEQIFPAASERIPVVVTGNYAGVERSDAFGASGEAPAELAPGPFLLTVAQHRRNKKLDVLISAYALARKLGVFSGSLVIVGSPGPESASLHRLVKALSLSGRVIFLRSLSDAALRWLYAHAALFVITSSTEGYCLPLVEALDHHAPVICSDIPILREIAGDECDFFSLAGDARQNLVRAMEAALRRHARHPGTLTPVRSLNSLAQYLSLYAEVERMFQGRNHGEPTSSSSCIQRT